MTVADLLVRRLADHAVRQVFGYPGGQLTPLYDALHRAGTVRHVLARDEQAAAFMADGFSRATGTPGVALAVCGPGVLNAATPLATALTDSVPLILLSGQVPSAGRGLRSGWYHENDQLSVCATCTKAALRVERPEDIVATFDRAWLTSQAGRPGPVLIEVPLDVLRAEAPAHPWPELPAPPTPLAPDERSVADLAAILSRWRRPLLLVGGGAVSAGASSLVVELAQRLGSPVFHTAMGKGAVPDDHPLRAGMTWSRATSDVRDMDAFFSPLLRQADGLLALGCRFTQLTTGTWSMPLPPELVQIDIDPQELGRHYPLKIGLNADLRLALEALLPRLPAQNRSPWTALPPKGEPWQLPGIDLVGPLRRALPRDAIVVADVTRLAYLMMVEFPIYKPRTFLHPAGYVSMGYGIPAALGARVAFPDRPIVAVVGDGGFLMSGMELASVVQEGLPIVVVLVNDRCLTLIKALQARRYENRTLGVDLVNPDFGLFARAFGVTHQAVHTEAEFETALRQALAHPGPSLVEVCL